MIRWASQYLGSIPAVFIDGFLYMLIAMFTFLQGYMSGDEAAKWVNPEVRFWMNCTIGSLAAACGAIKMFRSTSYSAHQDAKKEENTRMSYKAPDGGNTPTP